MMQKDEILYQELLSDGIELFIITEQTILSLNAGLISNKGS